MPTKGLAILGAGIFAKEAHLPSLAKLGDVFSLKAVYSRSNKSASAFAKDAKEVLQLQSPPDVYHDEDSAVSLDVLLARSDVDAVIVVLPITVQPEIILKALAAGKHVLSEKPVAPDVSKGRALIREYETKYKPKGLVWRVAENFEAEPGYLAARRIVQEGKLGKITYFSARSYNWIDENSKWYNTPWRTVPDYQGGFLLDGGVHTIAALRMILDSPFTTLSAHASLAKDILPPHDTINAIARVENGAHGIVELSWGTPVPTRAAEAHNSISVTGTDGWLEITRPPGVFRVTVKTATRDEKGKRVGEQTEVIEEKEGGVQFEIAGFLEALDGKDDGLDGPRGTLLDVAFIEAALNSGGAPVDVAKLAQL
ncbi:oxidoreductase family protein [Ganoderma leucocontextum]|nr:oxidoreductase family protein [Ganoderma leucocontextum]